MSARPAWLLLLGAAAACGRAGRNDPAPVPPSSRVESAPAAASKITFERMARWPEPGWQVPRSIAFSPNAELVTYLQSEAGNDEMALFAFDTRSKQRRVLLRASDLEGASAAVSREEELRRERQRQRAQGISAYVWAERAPLLIVPHGGDVYARKGEEPVVRLTHTPAPELDPKPCATGERVAFVRGAELFSLELASRRETVLTQGAPEGVTRGQSDFNGQEEFDEPSGYFWSPRCDRIA